MKADVVLFAKGVAMGTANVIPGVSGGTIALVTGIYERLIDALRGFGPASVRRLFKGDLRGIWEAVDGRWLCVLLAGVALAIVTLARLFEYLLLEHERPTMAFFFGLILVSIVYVAQRVTRWSALTWLALALGTAVAVGIALLAPGSPNEAPSYLFLCGMVAISSMILPGLSGSFVLILMGNYALVLGAIGSFSLGILVPLGLGCVIGLVVFSQLLGWIFERFHDVTLALMTGFVIGSLVVIWPWKEVRTLLVEAPGRTPREVVTGYDWFLPDLAAGATWIALALMLLGGLCIWALERGTALDPDPA